MRVVAQGYKLEFARTPPETGSRRTRFHAKDGVSIILEEVSGLCTKSAIVPVPSGQRGKGNYSTYFLVDKKDGGKRPILNLKKLNQFLVKCTFKVETLSTIISIMTPGVWLASIDLQDAYLHIPIAEEDWKFLRFLIGDDHLQFVVTPFGLAPAPMLFTRVVRVLIAWLRARGVHLYAYLDDILVVGVSPETVQHSL